MMEMKWNVKKNLLRERQEKKKKENTNSINREEAAIW